jgi:hypothetical protein
VIAPRILLTPAEANLVKTILESRDPALVLAARDRLRALLRLPPLGRRRRR